MKPIIAIDPGTTESAFVIWDGRKPIEFGKMSNESILLSCRNYFDYVDACTLVIEQIRSYGMPIGATTLDTVFWSGRFAEAYGSFELLPRKDVKLHICNSPRANDTTIKKALQDRFAYGVSNYGKGTKKEPGFFYGFSKDIWQAFALAVTFYDLNIEISNNGCL